MKKSYFYFAIISLVILSIGIIIGCGSGASSGGGGASAASPWIYVSSNYNDSIMVINGTTNTTVESIQLGFHPGNMAVSPDGKKLYVSNVDDDQVIVIDTSTNASVDAFIPVNAADSRGMAVTPNGDYLCMTSHTTTEFFKISTVSPYSYKTVMLTGEGCRIAITDDSKKAYVCVAGTGGASLAFLQVIDLQNMTIEATINVVNHPHDVVIKGPYAYVAMSSIFDCLARVNLNTSTVETINYGTSFNLFGVVSIPGKNKIYASDLISAGRIFILDTDGAFTFEATQITSTELSSPQLMAATSKYAYIVDPPILPNHDKVVVVDVDTDQIVKYINGLQGLDEKCDPVVVYK